MPMFIQRIDWQTPSNDLENALEVQRQFGVL